MEDRKFLCRNVIAVSLALLFIQCSRHQQKDKPFSEKNSVADSFSNKTNEVDSLQERITTSIQSEITCPKCGNKKTEIMPTDVCLLSYTCQKCQTVLHPKEGDCCVFCTYGDHKCPSKQ